MWTSDSIIRRVSMPPLSPPSINHPPLAPPQGGAVGGMSFPPHPLQWLELGGEGVAHIATDGAFCPIHWRGHPARKVKTRAQDSLSFGRGARPSRGGFGGTTFVPPESPLAGGTIGGWKEKPGLSGYPQGLAPGLDRKS